MKAEIFDRILIDQFDECTKTLTKKATEYAHQNDRLHNFKASAKLQGIHPKAALAGMMAKHTVSIYDMCIADRDFPFDLWCEKIQDHINYLVLLKAMILETEHANLLKM